MGKSPYMKKTCLLCCNFLCVFQEKKLLWRNSLRNNIFFSLRSCLFVVESLRKLYICHRIAWTDKSSKVLNLYLGRPIRFQKQIQHELMVFERKALHILFLTQSSPSTLLFIYLYPFVFVYLDDATFCFIAVFEGMFIKVFYNKISFP